jgi:4-hydroxybenzoate polyprenyltransferase
MQTIHHLLGLVRFSHTIFALPFALLAVVLAWNTPVPEGAKEAHVAFHWLHLLGVMVCMVAARTAAMAFNRLVDRKIDAANPRTANRHLPAGILSVSSVISLIVVSALAFVCGTLLFLPNWLPAALSLPVLAVLLGYSYAKRFTPLAHVWLGFALGLAPLAAWIAVRGEVVILTPQDLLPAVVLLIVVTLWVSGFDILYACQDAEFDRQAGLKSIPARYGVATALRIAMALHLGMLLALILLPILSPQLGLGWIYAASIAAVSALLIIEHLLVRPTDLDRVNIAFFNVNAVVSMGLLAAVTLDIWF